MFLQLERPGQIDATLRHAEAWRMLELLLDAQRDGESGSANWQDVLLADLAGVPTAPLLALFEERVAVAGPAWSRLAESVILVTVKDRSAWDALIEASAATKREGEGKVEVHELAGGVRLAFDGRTALIARPRVDAAFFGGCVKLLSGESRDALLRHRLFAEQVRWLPRAPAQGVFYFAAAEPSNPRSAGGDAAFGLWPSLRGAVIAMYVRDNSLDFVLRGANAAGPPPESPRVALPRLHHLPRSTIAAWAASVNLDAAFDRWVSPVVGGSEAEATNYGRFLREALDLDLVKRNVVGKLGPRIMLVWGRGLEAEEGGSSLAILLESTDAESVKRALDATITPLAAAVSRAYARDDEERLRVTHQEHLGTDITVVELADFAVRAESDGVARRLAASMRPCYAVLDGWLMAAWSVEHLRELIAAHNGVRPALGELADVGGLVPSRLGATALGVLQPATAASVLGRWLDDAERNPDSLLNPETWESLVEARGREAGGGLGLGLKPRHRPGRVLVLRVYDDGPCHEQVKSGDEIVAVGGMALSLEDANADLRRLLDSLRGEKSVTLRLERKGELIDVSVALAPSESLGKGLVGDAVRALRRVQAVIRPLTLATFAVTQSDAERFSAQLRLRFSEAPAARPASP